MKTNFSNPIPSFAHPPVEILTWLFIIEWLQQSLVPKGLPQEKDGYPVLPPDGHINDDEQQQSQRGHSATNNQCHGRKLHLVHVLKQQEKKMCVTSSENGALGSDKSRGRLFLTCNQRETFKRHCWQDLTEQHELMCFRHLQNAIVPRRNFRNITLTLWKTVMETQLLSLRCIETK